MYFSVRLNHLSILQRLKKTGWLICLVISACNSTSVETTATPTLTSSSPSPSVVAAVTQKPTPNPIFQPVLPKLQQPTQRLPIVLPQFVPETDGAKPVYAIAQTATPAEYEVLLAFTKDCTGGTACRLGGVFGELITPQTPPIAGKAVPLAQGLTGYFVDATCGANCSDSTLSWEQNKGRYTVALKAGKLETLVKMANSAIAP